MAWSRELSATRTEQRAESDGPKAKSDSLEGSTKHTGLRAAMVVASVGALLLCARNAITRSLRQAEPNTLDRTYC